MDIPGIDVEGGLVIVELKRGRAPDTVEKQALKYAALASRFTIEELARVHARYLSEVVTWSITLWTYFRSPNRTPATEVVDHRDLQKRPEPARSQPILAVSTPKNIPTMRPHAPTAIATTPRSSPLDFAIAPRMIAAGPKTIGKTKNAMTPRMIPVVLIP